MHQIKSRICLTTSDPKTVRSAEISFGKFFSNTNQHFLLHCMVILVRKTLISTNPISIQYKEVEARVFQKAFSYHKGQTHEKFDFSKLTESTKMTKTVF